MSPLASRQVDANTICWFADDPTRRAHCQYRAVVAYGPLALCGHCFARRSTIGKGMVPRVLVHGRDWRALEAVEAAAGLLRTAESSLDRAVVSARGIGHTWGELAVALGVTRQAAQQRFGRTAGANTTDTTEAQPAAERPQNTGQPRKEEAAP